MTLKLIVNGTQTFKFVLIEDSVDEITPVIFRAFVGEGITGGKEVHVICFDHSPEEIERRWSLQKNGRLFFHDLFSDSAGWLKDPGCPADNTSKSLFSAIRKSSADSTGLLIIADSLSSLILSYGFESIYRQIHQLINLDIAKGDCGRQLVSVVYPETLLNYDSIAVQLRHLATNLFTVTKRKGSMPGRFVLKVESKKVNGKLLKQMEECWLDSLSVLQSKKVEIDKELPSKSDTDEMPSQLTTFKLGLNEEEKAARSQLVLPYLRTENQASGAGVGGGGGGGSIFYEPDENDDWDEEDPDDDLDI